MKIKYSNGEEGDTKDMTDVKADMYENIQKLMEVFKKYDASFYLAVSFPQGENMAMTGAQRFKSSDEIALLFDYMEKQLLKPFGLKILPMDEPPQQEEESRIIT